MNFEIIATPKFKHELKRLVKKYNSLKGEFAELIEQLIKNPTIPDSKYVYFSEYK